MESRGKNYFFRLFLSYRRIYSTGNTATNIFYKKKYNLKNMTTRKIIIYAVLMTTAMFIMSSQIIENQSIKKDYVILPQSKLYLKGDSNVKDFTCDCTQYFPKASVELQQTTAALTAYFKNTKINLRTKGFDCGHSKINHDMYATLKASQFPYISIQLNKVRFPEKWTADKEIILRTEAIITIAGKSRSEILHVRAKKISDTDYRFTGQKALKMSNFDLTPPSALLDLIRVEDDITIHLDLFIETE